MQGTEELVLTALPGTVWALEVAMCVAWKNWCLGAVTHGAQHWRNPTPLESSALAPVVTDAMEALHSSAATMPASSLPFCRELPPCAVPSSPQISVSEIKLVLSLCPAQAYCLSVEAFWKSIGLFWGDTMTVVEQTSDARHPAVCKTGRGAVSCPAQFLNIWKFTWMKHCLALLSSKTYLH